MELQTQIFPAVCDAVREAGAFLDDRSLSEQVRSKAATDYVTMADTTVQAFLERRLGALCPDIGFLAEEQAAFDWDFQTPVWVLDPVDGTTNLIHKFQHSAISLALVAQGKPRMAVVYNPDSGEMFTACQGQGAFLNGQPIHVSRARRLGDALVSIGTAPGSRKDVPGTFRRLQRAFEHCQDIRRIGAASIDLCYVACGRLDAYFEEHLKPWDYAAGMLIVQEAGGVVPDRQGAPLEFLPDREILAANGPLLKDFMTIL